MRISHRELNEITYQQHRDSYEKGFQAGLENGGGQALRRERNEARFLVHLLEPFVVCEYPDENGEACGRCLACGALAAYERCSCSWSDA